MSTMLEGLLWKQSLGKRLCWGLLSRETCVGNVEEEIADSQCSAE